MSEDKKVQWTAVGLEPGQSDYRGQQASDEDEAAWERYEKEFDAAYNDGDWARCKNAARSFLRPALFEGVREKISRSDFESLVNEAKKRGWKGGDLNTGANEHVARLCNEGENK